MKNLNKESILKAIQRIKDNTELIKGRESFQYDLIYEGKKYPPILVISEANKILGGDEVLLKDFGNSAKKAFKILQEQGFHIEEKNESYYEELKKFLKQSKTTDLTYSQYSKDFYGLQVRASFGKGNIARIPWISFLGEGQKTEKGIYPVYLLYKATKKLILAYGVSEKKESLINWNFKEKKETINEYFDKNNLGAPERYGASYVFKVYNINSLPPKEVIDNDLKEIILQYKLLFSNAPQPTPTKTFVQFEITSFFKSTEKVNLFYESKLIKRFCASLLTKPFVILTGLSGSGKTKLAQAFVQWICQDESQYCIVPVGADWTNREPLLGYPNALKPEEYVKPDSGVLDLLIQANENPELPFFLILDEMNLSVVERYFADFLSVMESREDIPLFAEGTVENGVPAKLSFPSNLFIIGTVNIDETTNMFSPKVLDRANTIEFRVTKDEMKGFLGSIKDVNLEALNEKGAGMAESFLQMAENKAFKTKDIEEIKETLVRFFGELKKTGAEFGYRSASEIIRLINQLSILDDTLSINEKLDIAIMQKLLPKLHGSRRKLCPVLVTLGSFCIDGELKMEKDVFEKDDFDFNSKIVHYPLSLEKIARMHRGAIDNGFASFAEA